MVDHIANGEPAGSVRTKLNAMVDIANAAVTQDELDAALSHVVVSDADGGSVALTDNTNTAMLKAKADGSVETPYFSVNPTAADPSLAIQGALSRMGIAIDADGIQIGPIRIQGDGGGGFAVTGYGDRELLSCSEHGARVLGAVTVAPDGSVSYRGMEAQTAPDTGAMMYAGELALVSAYAGEPDMELPIYPTSLFGTRALGDQAILSVASWGLAPVRPWAARSMGGTVHLRYGRARGQTRISARSLASLASDGASRYDIKVADLTVHNVALPKSGSPRIMVQGDSIGERGTPYRIGRHLTAWGLTPTWIGTYPTRITPDSPSDVSGPVSETRGGSRLDEHWGIVNTTVVEDGGWGAYLALSRDQKKTFAPLARPATGSDASQYVSSGMTLDITRYLAGAGLASPTIWTLYLGLNDTSQMGGAYARATLLELIPKTIACIRRDLGNIPIILWTTMEARSLEGDQQWQNHATLIQTIVEIYNDLRTGDANIHLCPIHSIQDENLGWILEPGSTDSLGVSTTQIDDRQHPDAHNLEMHSLALAAMIAHLA